MTFIVVPLGISSLLQNLIAFSLSFCKLGPIYKQLNKHNMVKSIV